MAMQQQLDFIAYIQRMLVEGDFSATYKFALLHALADISIEKQQIDPSAQLQITFDELVEKFIALYWHQASPFGAIGNNRDQLLLQNTNSKKQAKIITTLHDAKLNNINSVSQLKKCSDWKNIRRNTLPCHLAFVITITVHLIWFVTLFCVCFYNHYTFLIG